MPRRFPLLLALVALFAASGAAPTRADTPAPARVFALLGDEQMLGRAFPVTGGESPDPSVMVWRDGSWQEATDPLDASGGVGPGISFGKRILADVGGGTVGLILCAQPGASMDTWRGGTGPYNNCVDQIASSNGVVDGLIVVQSQRDAADRKRASRWGKGFHDALLSLRRDVIMDLPVVIAQVGNINVPKGKSLTQLRASQQKAAEHEKEAAIVPTSDLALQANRLDFTLDSEKTLGQRLADAWWGLEQPNFESVAPPDEVFVLAGQSNMQGRALPLSLGLTPDSHLWNFRESLWRIAADPLSSPNDKQNGVGPGMSFGLTLLADQPGKTIGIVMCAKGGSDMTEWVPAGLWYQRCKQLVAAAGAPVAGFLFLQGESDAEQSNLAQTWAAHFESMLADFRTTFGAGIPTVVAEIGHLQGGRFQYQSTVRAQQEQAAAETPNVAIFPTSDLPTLSDGVHFTAAASDQIGVRFANAWLSL